MGRHALSGWRSARTIPPLIDDRQSGGLGPDSDLRLQLERSGSDEALPDEAHGRNCCEAATVGGLVDARTSP